MRNLGILLSLIYLLHLTCLQAQVPDEDGNSLRDSWESTHFGHTGVDPLADPDRDGQSNLLEMLAGTDPLDGNASLNPAISINPNRLSLHIQFGPLTDERTYTLERSSTVGSGATWSPLVTSSSAPPGRHAVL